MASTTIPKPYPIPAIGSVIITSTNTNPTNTYGGTWELVDKEYKPQIIDDTSIFTKGSVASFDFLYVILKGHTIKIRIRITTNSTLNDSDMNLGTFDLTKIGHVQQNCTSTWFVSQTDAGNAMVVTRIVNGLITSFDIVHKTSNGTSASGARIDILLDLPITMSAMADSFCNKFYWRRIV